MDIGESFEQSLSGGRVRAGQPVDCSVSAEGAGLTDEEALEEAGDGVDGAWDGRRWWRGQGCRGGRGSGGGIEGEGGGDLGVGLAGLVWREWRGWGEAFALCGGEGIGGGGLLGGDGGSVAVEDGLGEGDGASVLGRAAAGGGLAVDDGLEAAALEEHVLVGADEVAGFAEGVGEGERGRPFAAVFDAGVAVGGDAHAQVERAAGGGGDAQIRGDDGVGGGGFGTDFKGTAVEADGEGVGRAGEMERAGAAEEQVAATREGDRGGVVAGDDGAVAGERGAGVGDFGNTAWGGDGGVGSWDRADGLRVCRGGKGDGEEGGLGEAVDRSSFRFDGGTGMSCEL